MEGDIKVISYIYPTCSPSNLPLHWADYLKVVPNTHIHFMWNYCPAAPKAGLYPNKGFTPWKKHSKAAPTPLRLPKHNHESKHRGCAWSQVRWACSFPWSRGAELLEPVICSSLPWWHLFGVLVQGKLHLLSSLRPALRHRNDWELGNTHKCGRLMTTNWTNQHMGLGIPSGQHSILYTHHKKRLFFPFTQHSGMKKIIKMRMQMAHDEYAICRSYCSAGPERGVNHRLHEEAASSSKGWTKVNKTFSLLCKSNAGWEIIIDMRQQDRVKLIKRQCIKVWLLSISHVRATTPQLWRSLNESPSSPAWFMDL